MKTRVPIIETKAAIKCGRLRIIGADKAMKQIGMAKSSAYSGELTYTAEKQQKERLTMYSGTQLHPWQNIILQPPIYLPIGYVILLVILLLFSMLEH